MYLDILHARRVLLFVRRFSLMIWAIFSQRQHLMYMSLQHLIRGLLFIYGIHCSTRIYSIWKRRRNNISSKCARHTNSIVIKLTSAFWTVNTPSSFRKRFKEFNCLCNCLKRWNLFLSILEIQNRFKKYLVVFFQRKKMTDTAFQNLNFSLSLILKHT